MSAAPRKPRWRAVTLPDGRRGKAAIITHNGARAVVVKVSK